MKRILISIVAAFCASFAQAQGVLEFTTQLAGANMVPPTTSLATGHGSFTLNGTLFQGGVFTPDDMVGGDIHGSASRGGNAPILYGLPGLGVVEPDGNGNPGGLYFYLTQSITPSQVNDLTSGLWYVTLYSTTFPDGEIRGQIILVPEPSTLGLLGIGILVLWFRQRSRRPR